MILHHIFTLLALVPVVSTLDNGLGRTPPMGWNDWERFRCNVDCRNDPDNCISAQLFKNVADLFVSEGYKDAGYEYVNMDDCWLAPSRNTDGRLQADPDRFPDGIRGLADYVHSKGLKLGIYEDFGTKTCAGYPGTEYYLEMDAQTFADWQVDYLKLDGCYSDPASYDEAYPAMEFWLNKTGRPILYSCSWPAYQEGKTKPNYKKLAAQCNMARNYKDMQDSWDSVLSTIEFYAQDKYGFQQVAGPGFWNDPDMPNYPLIAKSCNIWRNYGDIQDSWDSLLSIIEFYGDNPTHFREVAGPGNFNDPDMLIIGNFGLSPDQERVQMALWSIMASPLIMSLDLRNVRPESKALLQNKGAIAVNQDPMGVQGSRIAKAGHIQIWTRPVLPEGSMAFVFLNVGTDGTPSKASINIRDLGLNNAAGYTINEVFTGKALGKYSTNSTFTTMVNPTGVFFGKATAL